MSEAEFERWLLEQLEQVEPIEVEVKPFADPKPIFGHATHLWICGKTGCLSGDTQILIMSDGVNPISLSELYNDTNKGANFFDVLSFNFKANRLEADIARIIYSGEKEMYRIKLKSGREVYASADHRFFVMRNGRIEEVKVKDLKVGDKIAVVRGVAHGKREDVDTGGG